MGYLHLWSVHGCFITPSSLWASSKGYLRWMERPFRWRMIPLRASAEWKSTSACWTTNETQPLVFFRQSSLQAVGIHHRDHQVWSDVEWEGHVWFGCWPICILDLRLANSVTHTDVYVLGSCLAIIHTHWQQTWRSLRWTSYLKQVSPLNLDFGKYREINVNHHLPVRLWNSLQYHMSILQMCPQHAFDSRCLL